MRFFFDNCISRRIVRGLCEFEAEQGHTLEHLTTRFVASEKDPDWLPALAAEGDWVILSADRKMRRSPDERAAWQQANLTTYFFSPKFAESTSWHQVEEVVHWWACIKRHATSAPRGTAWSVSPTHAWNLRARIHATSAPALPCRRRHERMECVQSL